MLSQAAATRENSFPWLSHHLLLLRSKEGQCGLPVRIIGENGRCLTQTLRNSDFRYFFPTNSFQPWICGSNFFLYDFSRLLMRSSSSSLNSTFLVTFFNMWLSKSRTLSIRYASIRCVKNKTSTSLSLNYLSWHSRLRLWKSKFQFAIPWGFQYIT